MTGVLEKKAIIYCRVASAAQGAFCPQMAGQLARCRDHAGRGKFEVVRTFREHAAGSGANRPQLNAMLAFLRGWQDGTLTIIVDDVSRLVRNVEARIAINRAIAASGAILALASASAPRVGGANG